MAFQGIDVEKGISGLNSYRDETIEIRTAFLEAFMKFNYVLYKVWGSPNAVKYNKTLNELFEFQTNLTESTNSVISTVLMVYDLWGEAQTEDGSLFMDSIPPIPVSSCKVLLLKSELEDYGAVIDPVAAQDCCDAFVSTCNTNILPRLEEMKIVTGIIDNSSDSMESKLIEAIEVRAKKFKDMLEDLKTRFPKAIEDEKNKMEVAVGNAENELTEYMTQQKMSFDDGLITKEEVTDNPETSEVTVTPEATVADSTETPTDNNSTPKVTPTPVVKPSSERQNFDRISFF